MMKTTTILGLIAMMIGTISSGTTPPASEAPDTSVTSSVSSEAAVSDTQNASIRTDAASYPIDVAEFKIIIDNQSGGMLQTGVDYQIERWNGTEWETLDLLFPVTMQLLVLPNGEFAEITARLWQDQYDYVPGQYRVRKNFWVNEQSQDVYAAFTLV